MAISQLETTTYSSYPIRQNAKPMHMQPVFKDNEFVSIDNGNNSKEIFERGLCLPSDIKMTKEEQQRVIDLVKECF
jgi:dTDP-4-amino-4,6-dideoxygalactose transaminase